MSELVNPVKLTRISRQIPVRLDLPGIAIGQYDYSLPAELFENPHKYKNVLGDVQKFGVLPVVRSVSFEFQDKINRRVSRLKL